MKYFYFNWDSDSDLNLVLPNECPLKIKSHITYHKIIVLGGCKFTYVFNGHLDCGVPDDGEYTIVIDDREDGEDGEIYVDGEHVFDGEIQHDGEYTLMIHAEGDCPPPVFTDGETVLIVDEVDIVIEADGEDLGGTPGV